MALSAIFALHEIWLYKPELKFTLRVLFCGELDILTHPVEAITIEHKQTKGLHQQGEVFLGGCG